MNDQYAANRAKMSEEDNAGYEFCRAWVPTPFKSRADRFVASLLADRPEPPVEIPVGSWWRQDSGGATRQFRNIDEDGDVCFTDGIYASIGDFLANYTRMNPPTEWSGDE